MVYDFDIKWSGILDMAFQNNTMLAIHSSITEYLMNINIVFRHKEAVEKLLIELGIFTNALDQIEASKMNLS